MVFLLKTVLKRLSEDLNDMSTDLLVHAHIFRHIMVTMLRFDTNYSFSCLFFHEIGNINPEYSINSGIVLTSRLTEMTQFLFVSKKDFKTQQQKLCIPH